MMFSPITTISISELLKLWGELTECYHCVHGYGGDTAEIYAYRLKSYSPRAHTHNDEDAKRACAQSAASALAAICAEFESVNDCRVTINNMSLSRWLTESRPGGVPFNHRAYVKVIKEESEVQQ
jgi:hypothetical protein